MRDNVLIVEDDATLRAVAAAFLSDAGLGVLEAPTADAALSVLKEREHEIGVVFTDVTMPGQLDGLALAKAVTAAWPGIKVIVTSANSWLRRDMLPDSVVFLPKPWLPLDMLTKVTTAWSSASH